MATPYHSVRAGRRTMGRMPINYIDFQVLVTAGIILTTYRFDFVGLFSKMLQKRLINRRAYQALTDRVVDHADEEMGQSLRFFSIIGHFVSFNDLIQSLRYSGYKDVALSLYNHRYNGIEVVHNIDVRGSKFPIKLYHAMKRNVDNHSFKNTQQFLRLNISHTSSALMSEHILGNRQDLADKMIVLYVLLVQQFNNPAERLQILDEMRASIPADVDQTQADVVYYSKKAVTMAFAGQAGFAVEELLTQVVALCKNLSQCFATTLAFHDSIEITSQQNIGFSSPDDQTRLSFEFDLGMRRLEGMPSTIMNQWVRTITLYYVMYLLGIRYDFEVYLMQTVTKENVTKARELLNSLANIFHDIEIRREMTFMICMARVHQDRNSCEALKYIKEAEKLIKEGTYFLRERENIRRYGEFLRRKATVSTFLNTVKHFVVIVFIIMILSFCVYLNIHEMTCHWLFKE